MKNTTRVMVAVVLILFGSAAWPFSDGFEAHAAPKCTPAITLDLKDGLKPVLLKGEVCIEAGKATAPCQADALGVCKREASPLPPIPPGPCDARPAGWTYLTGSDNRALTWDKTFTFPFDRTPSYLTPVGSVSGRSRPYDSGKPITGKIIAWPVTILAKNTTLSIAGSQPVPQWQYGGGQGAKNIVVTVTQCKGDIAVKATTCGGMFGSEFRLTFGPTAAGKACKFAAGTPVWINAAFPDPLDPLNPAKNGCDPNNNSGGVKCDRNFSAR